jgi:acyl CoA:acetate/3-ketoacid CoA transferase beta subunit
MSEVMRAEICAVAIAETFRGEGEILVSPIGTLPMLGARLAKLTFAPDILMTDGVASLVANVQPLGGAKGPDPIVEGWMNYRRVFDTLWSGTRHVMMGATQVDRFGNQNISCIGPFEKPKAMLLGFRGAPGNTLNHPTSYWVPNHSPRCFVEKVDVVTGVGYDRAAELGEVATRFHDIRRVISNLGVFDFATPDRSMRLASIHPGVAVDEIVKNTAFELNIPSDLSESRLPTDDELQILREVLDPKGMASQEVKG